MTSADILTAVKIDLGTKSTAYDERLSQMIEASKIEIAREGITLDLDNIDDCQLVIMYTGWLWRKRTDGGGMPRMIRYALNNRILSEKMKV